jgi:hypothetical protein
MWLHHNLFSNNKNPIGPSGPGIDVKLKERKKERKKTQPLDPKNKIKSKIHFDKIC